MPSIQDTPLTAAMEITEQIQFPKNARVLIIGAGRLGRLTSLVLYKIVSDLSVCIRSEVRDKQFDSSLKIVRPEDIETEYDYVVECSGQPSGFELALTAVQPRGCLIKALRQALVKIVQENSFHWLAAATFIRQDDRVNSAIFNINPDGTIHYIDCSRVGYDQVEGARKDFNSG